MLKLKKNLKNFVSFAIITAMVVCSLFTMSVNVTAIDLVDYVEPTTEFAGNPPPVIEPYGFTRTHDIELNGTTKVLVEDDSNWHGETNVKVTYSKKYDTNFQSVRIRVEKKAKRSGATWEEVDTRLVYLNSSETFSIAGDLQGAEFRVYAYMDSAASKGKVEITVNLS